MERETPPSSYSPIKPERPLITMCAWCMKMRDDSNQWLPAEETLSHPDTPLTHTICPDCLSQYQRELSQLSESLDS